MDLTDQLIYDNKETSNLFNDYFSTVFTKQDTTMLPDDVQFNVYDVLLDFIYFSEDDVRKLRRTRTKHLVLIKFILFFCKYSTWSLVSQFIWYSEMLLKVECVLPEGIAGSEQTRNYIILQRTCLHPACNNTVEQSDRVSC